VWSGHEVLVLQSGLPGRAFDPARQAWRSLAAGPDESTSFAATAVWTGRQVLHWAGGEQGLAYDPAADVWSTFDAGGLRRRSDAVVAWAGGILVGWGAPTTTTGSATAGLMDRRCHLDVILPGGTVEAEVEAEAVGFGGSQAKRGEGAMQAGPARPCASRLSTPTGGST